MPISSTPTRTILFRGVVVIIAGACSSGQNQETPAAGAATGSTLSSDTRSTAWADTTGGQADSPSAPVQAGSMGEPAPQPKIRPSIDPGRKTTPPSPPAGDTSPAVRDTQPTAAPATPAAAPAQSAGQDKWLSYDASTNTVTFELIGGPTGFQFNGYASGGATLVLPSKANVVMPFINKDGTPHSAEIISGEGPLPNAAVDPAIPRAYTNQLLQGLPQEGTDTMRFPVPEKGTYRIFCGVPGHGLSGMWIWMRVDPSVKTPSFGPTKG